MTMISNVRDWLEKQGFSLEMRAASAFRSAGFDVRQSSYYTDPDTSKAREIDVEANSVTRYGYISVTFFVECKSSDKPWVLLSSPDTLSDFSRVRAFSLLSKGALDSFPSFERFDKFSETCPWLKKKES